MSVTVFASNPDAVIAPNRIAEFPSVHAIYFKDTCKLLIPEDE